MQTIEEEVPGKLDAGSLLSVAASSVFLSTSEGLRGWLREEMQAFIPHEMVLVAWGNLKAGEVSCLVLGAGAQSRASVLGSPALSAKLREVFGRWLAADRMPLTLAASELPWSSSPWGAPSAACDRALAHGLADERAGRLCLYVFIGPSRLTAPHARHATSVLLPYIDSGFRQLFDGMGSNAPAMREAVVPIETRPRTAAPGDLSGREIEIMEWVCLGKRNHEIAAQLSLSKSTVKNHMHRIFQKLDVMNRAQAVERFGGRPAAGEWQSAQRPGQRAH